MASATLSFTHSSLYTTPPSSKFPQNQNQNPFPISLSKLNFTSSISTTTLQTLNFSSIKTLKNTQFTPKIVAKAAGTEAFVRENPAEVIEKIKRSVAEAEAAEPPKERAPRPLVEEVFAVVMIGSRQYIVFPGRWINTQRLKGANPNDKVVLNKVLLVGTKDKTYIGKPIVTNAVVHAVVEEQLLDDKVIVFKYKAKKNYRRNIGHRQPITRIKITGITGYEDFPAATLEPEIVSS
ncbi:large ribosomal subunit protein bL21c [Silene latifolia]|uniref:large ribosomal subunit protein bL21c n=1 Tax=Silene latifolia TaxID=37657 RepID=UPI003D77E7C8